MRGFLGEAASPASQRETAPPHLDADGKGRKHRAPDKVFVVDTECEGERGHGLLYKPGSSVNGISLPEVQKWRGAIFGL
jgi:hypothetical protein